MTPTLQTWVSLASTTVGFAVLQVLGELGMSPAAPSLVMPAPPDYLPVMLDGRVVGAMPAGLATAAVARLRAIKAARLLEEDRMPPTNDIIELEVPALRRLVRLPAKLATPDTLTVLNASVHCKATRCNRVASRPAGNSQGFQDLSA